MDITIDGKTYPAYAGEFVLAAAARNGVHIPTLCHHSALPGQACCRLCVVEAELNGSKTVVVSCVYPVRENLIVHTMSDKIIRLRRNVLTLMKARAPKAEGLINKYFDDYGVKDAPVGFQSGENEKCILCGLCVKACETLGTSAIAAAWRGVEKAVTTPYGNISEACMGCASCASVCPAGAIDLKEAGGKRTIWGKTFDLVPCEHCGRYFATGEQLNWIKTNPVIDFDLSLCHDCRRKAAVSNLVV